MQPALIIKMLRIKIADLESWVDLREVFMINKNTNGVKNHDSKDK
jgi:hypothetical protein